MSVTLSPFTRICSLIIVLVVVIAGAVVTIVNPDTLTFAEYIKDVAVGAGLLGIGHGIDASSKP